MASLFTSYSNSQQIDVTGNLTNFTNQATGATSTWQNAGTIGDPLTCWAQGDPGYCGPLPRVAAWGTGSNVINFSYGLTDLYQVVNIKNALINSGTGLQVNGFNFGFTAKNGNGWDNGQPDQLSAYVNIYNNTNSTVLESYNYNLNGKYDWKQFSYSETFKSPYSVPSLGNAQYGFVGQDNNFWVGPYGPEITGVSFSLKYSVDPCATNPLYSPTCKGYMDALAKLSPAASTSTDTLSLLPNTPLLLSGTTSSQTSNDGQSSPPGPSQTTTAATLTPTSNNTQSRAGEVSVAGAPARSSSGPSMSMIMSILSTESNRVGSVERSAVAAAVAGAEAAGSQATQQAEAVAESLTSQSIAASMTSANGTGLSISTTANQSQSSIFSLSDQSQSAALNTTMLRLSTQYGSTTETVSAVPTISSSLVTGELSAPTRAAAEVEIPQSETIQPGSRSVLNDAIESRPVLQQATQQRQTDAVNKNAQSNELAGGVDIAAINQQPVGFQNYSFVLTDAQFYAPREIYRNQRTVDNARALRQLTNDGRHREMVEQQYKRN